MTTKSRKQVNMDIRNAVSYTEVQISHGVGAFFVDCEFGRVCIDTNPFDETNPAHPCLVTRWKEAPDTKFASAKSGENADFYAAIDIYGSMVSDHLTIIEAFTRCMFMHLGFTGIDDFIIDAAVFTFVNNYDSFTVNINMMEREFRKNHLKGMVKRDKAVQAVIRELFQRKITMSEKILIKSMIMLEKYLQANPGQETVFYDTYCKELFGLIIYANNEAKEMVNRSYQLMLDYNDDTNTNKSVSVFTDMLRTKND